MNEQRMAAINEWERQRAIEEDFRSRLIVTKELTRCKQLQAGFRKAGITDPVLDDYIEGREMQLERLDLRAKQRKEEASTAAERRTGYEGGRS